MPKKEYGIGDQVEHKLFGEGTILAVDGNSAKLTIKFRGKDSRIIIAKYVKLVKK